MKTYVALFRGINVGGRGMLPMKELVTILEESGFTSVRTYIQSGNAVFQSSRAVTSKVVGEIVSRIRKSRGFSPVVMIVELADLARAIERNPFEAAEGNALHLFFLERKPDAPDLEGLAKLKTKTEEFKLDGSVFYLHTPDGLGRSKLAANIERRLGVAATGRNWNTVNKLLEIATK
ncbi:MAG: DUF1697 domain-containing protein [Thermoanaerobaculia bacterium]